MISSRSAEADDRAVPGHWEGDLIIGLNRSAIGTLVERSSRFTMLVHLPRENGYGLMPRTKNGPALGGYGAVTMANALKKTVAALPDNLKQSLTWDRGKELSDHARFTIESGVKVFFADSLIPGTETRAAPAPKCRSPVRASTTAPPASGATCADSCCPLLLHPHTTHIIDSF